MLISLGKGPAAASEAEVAPSAGQDQREQSHETHVSLHGVSASPFPQWSQDGNRAIFRER